MQGPFTAVSISAATNANPVVFTAASAPPTGPVTLAGLTGSWAGVNGTQQATNLTPTTFSVAVDSTSFGAYPGGASWITGPSLFDLTTISSVQAILPAGSSAVVSALAPAAQQAILQGLITSASLKFINETGRAIGANGTGPYAGIDTYSETYDGNGGTRQFLVNAPIQAVSSLTIGNTAIQASTSFNVGGYVIDGTKASISLRWGGGTTVTLGYPGFGGTFGWLPQSVFVNYTAGYSTIPQDIADTLTYFVAEVFLSRSWLGQASQNLAELGTVSYRSWEMSPRVRQCVTDYKRVALV